MPVVEEKTAVKQVFGCLFLRTARENSCFFGGLVWELKSGFSMTPTADVRWFILQVYNEHKCLKQLDQPAWEPKRGFFFGLFHLHPLIQVWDMGGRGWAMLFFFLEYYLALATSLPQQHASGGHRGTQTLPPQYGGDSWWNVLLFNFPCEAASFSPLACWKLYQQSFSASSPRWEDLKGPVMLRGIAVRWRESFPRPCRGVNTTEFTLWNKYKQSKNGTMFVFFWHLNKNNSWKKNQADTDFGR